MRFGSVCSGIEAASVAWSPLGWEAAWLAEVDVAASLVLAHRFGATAPQHMPSPFENSIDEKERKARATAIKRMGREKWGDAVVNWGDFTRLPEAVRSGAAEGPDVLCGGTPCQAFSIAGLRGGLDDPRGQLTLSFVELADAIDERRAAEGKPPCIIFWENVPGVLSHEGNPFGHFLAALAGDDDAIEPGPRPESGRSSAFWTWKKASGEHSAKWPVSGAVVGPSRTVAWVVKDAQFFGLAQRRERVFVVASAREGFDPAAVLFEFDGVRRDSAPSRESWEEIAGTLAARTDGGGFPGTDEACSGYVQPVRRHSVITMAHGQGGAEISEDRCPTLTCNHEAPIAAIPILESGARTGVSTTDQRSGMGIGKDGDPMFTLQAGKQHGVALSVALRGREGGGTAELGDELAGTLRASSGGGDKPHVLAFSCKDYGADATLDLAPTMRAMGHAGSHANAGGQLAVCVHGTQDPIWSEEVALPLGRNQGQENAVCVTGDVTHTLTAEGFDASEDGTGRGQPIVPVYGIRTDVTPKFNENLSFTLTTPSPTGGGQPAARMDTNMAVRRLMPVECERLQGFPDGHTLVPIGNKLAADGPRYKQLGNSWAVPVVRWIGARIAAHIAELDSRKQIGMSPWESILTALLANQPAVVQNA